MNRRELLAAVAAMGLAPAGAAFAQTGSLRAAAREAWIYSLPLIEMATTRARNLAIPGAALNRFTHARRLAGPEARAVTAPNNDTLYSTAWLDLSKGPVSLAIPPTGDRYISVAVMNMYSDNDVVLGTRTLGGGGGKYTLVGPGQPGLGPNIVRIATPQAWCLARTLVAGPDDLPAVAKVQDGLTLNGPAGTPPDKFAGRMAPWAEYFASAQALIVANPPPATDGAAFERMAPLGLGPRGGFDPKRFDAARASEIEAGIADAKAALRAVQPGAVAQGWNYPRPNLGDYGQDYLFRAAVALGGLAALPPAEATYLHPAAERGRMFVGAGPYRLHFPAGQLPPVDGFWSLTMYQGTEDGQFFLVPNPARRYAIGDRTPGLTKNADGSLDIWIARADPGGERTANWLPAPAEGPFTLSLRAYLPRPELLDGRYRLPAIAGA
jgi:hypothetical protein